MTNAKVGLVAASLLCSVVGLFPADKQKPDMSTLPQYADAGKLKLPEHHREWVYLTTGFGIGIAAVFVILLLLGMQAKNYHVSPVYPLLLASGAVFLERLSAQRLWLRKGYPLCSLISGCPLAPLVMPILSPKNFLAYHNFCHDFTPVVFEDQPERPLPQYFSDESGWEGMVQTTAHIFHQLPAQEQPDIAIFANDYGQAAAVDFFGPRYGLPASISKAETYWSWGPRQYDGWSVIVLGSDCTGDREDFRSVQAAGDVEEMYSRGDERLANFMCRGIFHHYVFYGRT